MAIPTRQSELEELRVIQPMMVKRLESAGGVLKKVDLIASYGWVAVELAKKDGLVKEKTIKVRKIVDQPDCTHQPECPPLQFIDVIFTDTWKNTRPVWLGKQR